MIAVVTRAVPILITVYLLMVGSTLLAGQAFPGQMVAGTLFTDPESQQLAFYDLRTARTHIRLPDTQVGTLPLWSPDGTEIAYTSMADGDSELYIVPTFSGKPRQITHNREFDNQPVYSHDGQRIAFVSNRAGHYNLYVMHVSGQNVRRLTSGAMDDYYPAWSPDDTQLVFVSWMTGASDLHLLDIATRQPQQLTTGFSHETYPVWSPDGQFIAYVAESTTTSDIFMLDSSSEIPRQITNSVLAERSLTWAADGTHLYFAGFESGQLLPHLYRANVATGNTERISGRVPFPAGVAWKP